MRQININGYIFILSFLVIGLLIKPDLSDAATFNVPGDFATIQEAIDDPGTINGDIINVGAGTHIEAAIHITKELTIQGQGIGVTILDPSSLGGEINQLFPDTDNVIIQDLTVQNASNAIRFEMAEGAIDNTTIQRVSMSNNTSRGIEIHNNTTVTNLTVTDSVFDNTNVGIRVSSSGHLDGVTFSNTTFSNNAIGIYVANDGGNSTMANMQVTNCTFTNHTSGQGTAIFLEEAQNTRIQDNMFIDNFRDIQLFKWYQASIPMSNIIIRRNTMIGTTNAVFALFNADNVNSGQTVFNDVRFIGNTAVTNDGSAVYAGAHSTFQNADPSMGGIGWDTVRVRNNCFTGITTAGNGVRFFIPAGITPDQALGGASIDVTRNWWGTTNLTAITALMQVPAITDFEPFRNNDICDPGFFSQQPLFPSAPGVLNTLSILSGTPDSQVSILYGFEEGISDASVICEDSEIDMNEFFELATTTADSNGDTNFSFFIPGGFDGVTALIQAVELETCIESDLNSELISAVPSITLLPVVPGNAGEFNNISVIQATPSFSVAFVYGFAPGVSDGNSICTGLQIDMDEFFVLPNVVSDINGQAGFNIFVPLGFAGTNVLLQAVDVFTCTASNVVSETF